MGAGDVVGLVAVVLGIVSIFVVLPWMILNFLSKTRSANGLTDEDQRMLEDLWRSARTMERRIETLERLVEPDSMPVRPRPSERTRGDIN